MQLTRLDFFQNSLHLLNWNFARSLLSASVILLPSALFAVAESYNNANLLPLPPTGHPHLQNKESLNQDDANHHFDSHTCSCCLGKPCFYQLNNDEFEDDANYPGKDEGNLIDYFSR